MTEYFDPFGSRGEDGDDAFTLTSAPELTPREAIFVAELCRTNFNAAAAYTAAGYRGGRHNAARLCRKPRIQQAIRAKLAARIASGDEALAILTMHARGDIRKVVPPESRIAQLPDDVAATIKAVTPTRYGERVELHCAQQAAKILAQAAGKLKETVKIEVSLEQIIARANRLGPGEESE
jgi:phage terminase small subunit